MPNAGLSEQIVISQKPTWRDHVPFVLHQPLTSSVQYEYSMRRQLSACLSTVLQLTNITSANGLPLPRWLASAACSDVDAINQELADFFGVKHMSRTSSSHSMQSPAIEAAGQSAMGFTSESSSIPVQQANTQGALEHQFTQPLRFEAQAVVPKPNLQPMGSSALEQLQQCSMQLQQQALFISGLVQQLTVEQQQQQQQQQQRILQSSSQRMPQQHQQQQQQQSQYGMSYQAPHPSGLPAELPPFYRQSGNQQQQQQHSMSSLPAAQPYALGDRTAAAPTAAAPPASAAAAAHFTSTSSLAAAAATAADGANDTQQLTHVDSSGKASMVDVSHKNSSSRIATASCIVFLGPTAFTLVRNNQLKKGDVLTLAQVAGIQGAKQTPNLIPLCHNICLSKVDVGLQLEDAQSAVVITATAKTLGQTGVEMEALTAVSVAALTVYDMCKAVSKEIIISDIKLDFKSGGKSGTWARGAESSSSGSSSSGSSG